MLPATAYAQHCAAVSSMSLVATDRYHGGCYATRGHQSSRLSYSEPHVQGFSLLRQRTQHATVHSQRSMSPSGKQSCKL